MWRDWNLQIHCSWDCKMVVIWKTVKHFLKIFNVELSYDPEILFLGLHPRELKTYVLTKNIHKHKYSHSSIFIIPQKWK